MKIGRNILLGIGCMFVGLVTNILLWSCTDEAIPENRVSSEGIHFGTHIIDDLWKNDSRSSDQDTSIMLQEKTSESSIGLSLTIENGISSSMAETIESRGSQYSGNTLNEFKVAAYYFNNGTVRDYFVNTNGNNGLLVTDGVNPEISSYWPFYGTLDFMAIFPKDVLDKMPLASAYNSDAGASFTYTIDSDDIQTHTDIMVAVTKDKSYAGNSNTPVALQFEHLLAAVQFKVGKMLFIKINSITVTGVKGGTVTFTYQKDTNKWNYTANNENETYTITEGLDTYGLTEGAAITSNEEGTMLLLMPQTLTANAKLIVNYDNLLTGETGKSGECALVNPNVAGSSLWEAGKTYAYALNIGTTFDVTIPAPTNQDAHYVMVPMSYRLGNLPNISNITASVEYINNTASQDVIPTLKLGSADPTKTALADLELLTDLQKQGYWTDKLYTAADDGTVSYENGVSVRGDEDGTLSLTNTEGTIVMFLPENTGKTDRDVVLNIKGEATVNEQTVELTIGKCQFKQLCPSWVAYNGGYIGSERIVESIYANDDGRYPYGFKWNRKVTYTNDTRFVRLLYSDAIASLIGNPPRNTAGTFTTLNNFIEYTVDGNRGIISKIVLNYAAINNLRNVADSRVEGDTNTRGLYDLTAGVNPSELEASLDGYVRKVLLFFQILNKNINNNSAVSSEYAAFTAIKRNKFNEISRTFVDNENDNDPVTTIVPELTDEGINWYLPSINEGIKIKDAGEYALKTDDVGYWTSTSYEDDNSNSKAYYFQYNPSGDNYSSIGDRTTERRVRAVVKWTGQGSPLDAN